MEFVLPLLGLGLSFLFCWFCNFYLVVQWWRQGPRRWSHSPLCFRLLWFGWLAFLQGATTFAYGVRLGLDDHQGGEFHGAVGIALLLLSPVFWIVGAYFCRYPLLRDRK